MFSQRGDGKAGCIFWVLVLGVVGMFAFRYIPAQVAHAQLEDHCDEMAKMHPEAKARQFSESLLKRAHELRIPLRSEDVNVETNGRRVRIEAHYVVPMDFLVYTWEKKFDIDIERDIFKF